MQWGYEYQTPEIKKHLNSELVLVRYSNGKKSCDISNHIIIWHQDWRSPLLLQKILLRICFYCSFGAIIVKTHLQCYAL